LAQPCNRIRVDSPPSPRPIGATPRKTVVLMPQVLQWPQSNRPGDESAAVIEVCRRCLVRGQLVGLPTEAGYVVAASALHPEAAARLAALRADGPLPAIAIRGPDDARDWIPELGPLGGRLTRRCWPGPVLLAFSQGAKAGAATRLPEGVLRTIGPGWDLGLMAPRHPAVRELLESMPVPLMLGELAGESITSAAALAATDIVAVVVVDDGPTQFNRPTTVVQIRGEQWDIRREGAMAAADLVRAAAKLVLFVCTGNTCRSPLAAALCAKRLADRLECGVDDLPARGFVVASAGLAALRGEPAAADAVTVAAELGADLSGHFSRPATGDILADADLIVGMTAGHLHGLEGLVHPPQVARLLCGDADLADPIGGDLNVYQACAGSIWQHLQRLVEELTAPTGG
jgi:L-threonylcarbamoyladenylate synthase